MRFATPCSRGSSLVVESKAVNTSSFMSKAIKLAESLVTLGLSTCKVRTYAKPRTKTVEGRPSHRHVR